MNVTGVFRATVAAADPTTGDVLLVVPSIASDQGVSLSKIGRYDSTFATWLVPVPGEQIWVTFETGDTLEPVWIAPGADVVISTAVADLVALRGPFASEEERDAALPNPTIGQECCLAIEDEPVRIQVWTGTVWTNTFIDILQLDSEMMLDDGHYIY